MPIKKYTTKNGIKLTRKEKSFADAILKDPTISATEAALQTFGKTDKPISRPTAGQIGYEKLKKPEILSYLRAHSSEAEKTVIDVMQYSAKHMKDKSFATLALSSANSILDRTQGKAVPNQNYNITGDISITLGNTIHRKALDPTTGQDAEPAQIVNP